MRGTIHTPYYDWDGRKYLEISCEGGPPVRRETTRFPELGGPSQVLRVKVPWRYGRVMCRVEGLRTIQELQKGDQVEITLEKKTWDGLEHWVLSSIKT
jgi:hypothetical protein